MSARPCPNCGHVPAAPTELLTERQAELLRFLCDTIDARGTAPTCDEMCLALGVTSIATVAEHLVHLELKGYILRARGQKQALTVLHRLPAEPARKNGVPLYDERRTDAQPARLRGVHS
jgi:SOS-response transcriptional repressor LexA